MPQYLSNDPNAGIEPQYISTDPNAGDDAPELVASHGATEAAPERTWTDTAVDALPAIGGLIGGTVGLAGGPAGAVLGAGIGGAGGEGWRRTVQGLRGKTKPADESVADTATGIATEGGLQAAYELTGQKVIAPIMRLAGKGVMRGALGAQRAVRGKFPTVDLESVAMREGFGLGGDVSAKAMAANKAVSAAGRAADDIGAARIQPREMAKGLRPLYDRAKQTRMGENAQQIVEEANKLRKNYRGGLSVEDALATKSEMASQARQVMQGAADPRSAGIKQKVLGATSRATGNAVKERGGGIADALEQSQELMALEKAVKGISGPSRLRLIMGAGAGVGAGAANGGDPEAALTGALSTYAMTSPKALGLLAQLLAKGAPVGAQTPRALAALMSAHGNDK